MLLPLLVGVGDSATPVTVVTHYAVVLYSATRISRLLDRTGTPWLDLMFWAFGYVWLGLAGFVQRVTGHNPYDLNLGSAEQQLASLLTVVGFVGYDLGRSVVWPRLERRRRARPRSVVRVLSEDRVVALAIVALVATPVVVVLLGGLQSLFTNRYERGLLLEQAGLLTTASKFRGGSLIAISYALPLAATLGIGSMLRTRPELRRRPAWVLALVVLALMTLLVGNPVSSSRYWVGTIVLSLVFVSGIGRRRHGFRLVGLGVLAALLVLFPYADRFRYANYVESSGRGLVDLMVGKADYDASLQMVNVVGYVNDLGHTFGRQLGGALLFFIPRQVWSDKPIGSGTLLTQHNGLLQVNVSAPLWAEAYLDGGYLLVLIVFVIVGVAAGALQRTGLDPNDWRHVYACVVAAYSPIMLRGSLLANVGGFVVLTLAVFVLTVRRRTHRSPGSSIVGRSLPSALRTPIRAAR